MRRLVCSVVVLALAAGTAACGSEEPSNAPASPAAPAGRADRAKARLLELFALVKQVRHADAARYIVYRGPDEARNWKDLADYERDKDGVDDVVARIWRLLEKGGEPAFDRSETKREREGEWLAWFVTFGTGDRAKRAVFAFLEVKGVEALGDID